MSGDHPGANLSAHVGKPTATDLQSLLARVEAAGADRELDAAICRVTHYAAEQPDGTWIDTFAGGYRHTIYPPNLTASLDAALALVERVLPNVMWRVGFDPDFGNMKAELVTEPMPLIGAFRANHSVPALALLAALLRALIAANADTSDGQVSPGMNQGDAS